MSAVLLVDDEHELRKKYKKILKQNGFDVIEAPDAIDVANVLMRDRERISMIVLDIQIPDVDGRGIYDIVTEYAPNIPIMISSVLPLNDQKLRIPKARDYFQKSDDDEQFLGKIKAVLN